MKKLLCSLALAGASAAPAMAGGLLTATNQNAASLRFFAQDANITLSSLYANPAGSAFLTNGWHMGLSSMTVMQKRTVHTQFPIFALNKEDGNATHTFKGDAFAPLVPSIDVSYNQPRWSVNAHFGLTGGGGSCEFLDGIGSFESVYAGQMAAGVIGKIASQLQANTPWMTQQMGALMGQGMTLDQAKAAMPDVIKGAAAQTFQSNPTAYLQDYSLDAYMKGRQYYFGLSVGGTYKVKPNLAVFGGLRGVYATCNYNGYVQDVLYTTPAGTGEAKTLAMNCDQTGIGITPILGVHWRVNKHFDFAGKYEFKTRMRLKNTSRMNNYTEYLATNPTLENGQTNEAYKTLSQFVDGKSIAEDIPAMLTLGAQYTPVQNVRIGAGWRYYFDKQATKYGGKHKQIDRNTMEILASAEWKCCKWLTVSGSWQNTRYGLSDKYMNDVSYNLNSNSMGMGVRIHAAPLFNIDLGYMHTFYQDRSVVTPTALGNKIDRYTRDNDVIGIGFNFAFGR